MLNFQQASPFNQRADVLVCPVNLMGYANEGMAAEVQKRYPKAVVKYRESCNRREISFLKGMATKDNGQIIYFFPTKADPNKPSKMEWIEQGLASLRLFGERYPNHSITMTLLECTEGRLSYSEVILAIYLELRGLSNDISVCDALPRIHTIRYIQNQSA